MYSFALIMWEVLSVQTPPFPGCTGLRVAHEVAYSGLRPAMDGLLPLAEINALRRTGQTHGLTGRPRGAGAAKTTTQKKKTTKEGNEEQKSGSENQGDRGENHGDTTGHHHPRDTHDDISNDDEDRMNGAVNGAVNGHQSSPPPPGWLVELMRRCWAEDPKHRPSFADICECLQSRSVAGLDRGTGGEPPEGYARTLKTLKYGLEAPPGNGRGQRRM